MQGQCWEKSINIWNFILENDCLAGVITETWLNREKELDVEFCDLNIQGFKLDAVNRKGRKVGGLALVYRQHCAVRKLCHRSFSFNGNWLLEYLLSIYNTECFGNI